MKNVFSKILTILPATDRRQFYTLMAMMVMMGVLEVVGIGSLLPFMAVITDMDSAIENKYLRYIYNFFAFESSSNFAAFLGSAVLVIFIARNAFFTLAHWFTARFTTAWQHHISVKLLRKYIYQPYSYFVSKNTLDLKRRVFYETSRLVNGVIIAGIQVFAKSVIAFFIILLLIAINPVVAMYVGLSLGGSYLLLYMLVYRKLNWLSNQAGEVRTKQFKIVGEAFEGIKEIKLSGKEDSFINHYATFSRNNASLEAVSRSISSLPKYGIETIAISGIMLFIVYLIINDQDIAAWVPLLSVYILSGYRMLPALQGVFSGVTRIRFNLTTLDALYKDFTSLAIPGSGHPPAGEIHNREFHFRSAALKNVDFCYPESTTEVISKLDLVIESKTTVGMVGPTGSGKTTIVDIILGLLTPVGGSFSINDVLITEANIRDWKQKIGYVPQKIFFLDDTVAKNIAFGFHEEEISQVDLETAAKTANLHDYIVNELPNGYQTVIGQRGIRLSGGQQQRLGIARAVYPKPELLVLDEATSALDGVTELIVMEAIQKLSHKMTIIIIAHRLNTVKNCDIIHYIDKGSIISSGTFDELSRTCKHFQKNLLP